MGKRDMPRKPLSPEDVTKEYLQFATPGQGTTAYDSGYNMALHQVEINFSKWLHDTFGGDIRLLEEANQDKVHTPDYIWRGKLWDLKTTSTEKSADAAIRHGLKQINENPGGVFLDYRGTEIDLLKLKSVIDGRMRHSNVDVVDIMVVLSDENVKVFKYRK